MYPPRVVAGHTKIMEGEPCPGASSGLDGTEILILNQQKVSQKDERLSNSQCPWGDEQYHQTLVAARSS